MRFRGAWLVALAVFCGADVYGQSLGEVARKEKERRARQGQSTPSRVITNEDLRGYANTPAGPVVTPTAGASPAASPSPTVGASPPPSPSPTPDNSAESYWRQRASRLRERVKNAEKRCDYIEGST